MGIAWTVSEIIEHWLFSWLRSVWPWMKGKVNIINTWCMPMSESVSVPSLTMMISTVSKESFARDTNKHTQTHRLRVVYVNLKFALQTMTQRILSCCFCFVFIGGGGGGVHWILEVEGVGGWWGGSCLGWRVGMGIMILFSALLSCEMLIQEIRFAHSHTAVLPDCAQLHCRHLYV